MANLIGEYDSKLDQKGRFLLPSALKKQLDPKDQDRFVMNRGFEGCLVLYPASEWEKETANMSKLNLYVAKNRKFYRQFHNGATVITPDNSGRILVPKSLKGYAEINKDLVLFAYANRIELWAKDKYNAMMDDGIEDFADLAEDVMGSVNDEEKQ